MAEVHDSALMQHYDTFERNVRMRELAPDIGSTITRLTVLARDELSQPPQPTQPLRVARGRG